MPSAVAESVEYQAALNGRMFMAGSGALTLGLVSYFRSTIANPTGSGKIVMITRLDSFSTASATFAHLWLNPTVGLPVATARPILNCNVDSNNTAGVAVIKTEVITQLGNSALSGGVDTGIDIALGPNAFEIFDLPPILLRPGQTIGLSASIPIGVNLATIVRWMEQSGT